MKFSDIRNQRLSDLDYLVDNEKYLAHLPLSENLPKESLKEHIKLVEEYSHRLIELHGLENCIDIMIGNFLQPIKEIDGLSDYTKILFHNSLIYHDFGKINHLFQQEKMKNFNPAIKVINHREGSHHSAISAYIFINHHLKLSDAQKFNESNQVIADFLTICFSFPIYKHHSSYLEKFDSKNSFIHNKLELLSEFLFEFKNKIEAEDLEFYHELISDIDINFERIKETKLTFDFFPLFALLKLNYSLLTASDYYATSHYMNNLEFKTEEDFGVITEDLKKHIFHYFENNEKKAFNAELFRNLDKYSAMNVESLTEKNNKNLNLLRQKLGAEVIQGIERYTDERIFYIEAPTGGGKTNMSLIAIRKLLEIHPEINKVFYVFPFTTLITQTDKAIKETFGLTNLEVTQVHSKSGFQIKSENIENEIDANYGNLIKNQIENIFVNYPFTLLTHIKFFDILKSNKKDTNYLLHRLANSVVIIDEMQSYNPEHWDKIKFFISKYAELFNMRFVIMSATLPKIDKISISNEIFPSYTSLINNAQQNYLCNPNFANRVSIKTELLDKTIELPELSEIVLTKSKQYAENRTDAFRGSVHTIIEFIFKKSASEFYNQILEINDFFDDIFVLSGTILEPRRKFIIEYLKNEKNKHRKILLITTQVVEAGVDIDMDLGFKNQSLLDSDEQLAGRINRNVNKENCELWLFKHDKPKSIYGKDLRFEVTANFSKEYVREILLTKNFKDLYEKVFEKIDKKNQSAYKVGFNEYKAKFGNLNFEAIQKDFMLIESENVSVFIPADIDVICYENEMNFLNNENEFIKKYNCFCIDDPAKVSGEKIWELYRTIAMNKQFDIMKKNIEIKILNGIMSKFVFSIFARKIDDLTKYCEYNEEAKDFKFNQYYKLNQDCVGKGCLYDIGGGLNEAMLNTTFEFI